MFWTLSHPARRKKLSEDARRSRESRVLRAIAIVAVIAYNIVGVADITSTIIALESGAGTEANPFLRVLMDNIGAGWVVAKLFLQGVITWMVLWFPHWIVLSMFYVATIGNGFVVYSNLQIGGIL